MSLDQSVKRPALDFSSGHDLTVREIEPCTGLCAVRRVSAWDSSLFLSLKINKHQKQSDRNNTLSLLYGAQSGELPGLQSVTNT